MPTKPDVAASSDNVLDIRDLSVRFELGGDALARLFGRSTGTVHAVDGVNLSLRKGEVVGLVGESGSGKSTLGRALLGLVPAADGSIVFGGNDIAGYSRRQLREHRRHAQMVFQDPNAALNPAMTVEQGVGDALRIQGVKSAEERRRRVIDALEHVGLSPVDLFLPKYPRDLSGGQKQRVVIARAIVMGPTLLVADEPISMLDMSVRAKILQLMLDLKREFDLTYVYITHDLASAKFFCDRIAIMYLGRIVELGDTEKIFADPKHPYTKALLAAIPDPDPSRSLPRQLLTGEIPDAARPPLGCSFHPRCPAAFEKCGWEPRDLVAALEKHWLKAAAATYDVERSKIANLDALASQEGGSAKLQPSRSGSVADLRDLLEEVKTDPANEAFWRGVREVRDTDGAVEVVFHEGSDPMLRDSGSVEVACHLF
ncbi:MAG TPA: ABC transporter ATP-binding protein [Nocardioidaceae bacterium]|nr:ABC transporter ATP-binding protein [Nocardioidaceae bacterium]